MAIKRKPLNEQVMVVTGASSGIGLATAESAAKAGARMVLAARSGRTLDEVVARINSSGGQAISVVCDVGDREQVRRLAQAAIDKFGRIDTWVNDAGVGIYGRLDQIKEDDARRMFDTNFWGTVHGSLIALEHMKQQGGALINIGSEVSEAAAPVLGMYVASKHAVRGFTSSLRIEVEEVDKLPVSVTLIEPPGIDTPFDEHARNYSDKQADLPGSLMDPHEVAAAILDAAVNPTRVKKLGMRTKMNTFVSNNLPGVADRVAAKQADKMHRDEPARNPAGALHTPGESGRVHGDHPSK